MCKRESLEIYHEVRTALIAHGSLTGELFPGRCPGLSHYAPLGQTTGGIMLIVHRLATGGYVREWLVRGRLPSR
ncbi:MAG: hypothetical protein RL240_1443 [Planctomycetota bacterium]|jgi:hypothetical protein